jgi:arylsulfatase
MAVIHHPTLVKRSSHHYIILNIEERQVRTGARGQLGSRREEYLVKSHRFAPALIVLGVIVTLAGCADTAMEKGPGSAADQRPNVLLVVVDDVGWTDVGSFGGEIATPNIDALAARGVRFTDFHVSMSCSPTRSMLLSGTDNHIAGLGNMGEVLAPNQIGKPGYEGYLNDRVISLAEALKGGGYHTYMAGKWHMGHEPDRFPRARGFERSFALLFGGASHWDDMSGMMEIETPAHFTMEGETLDELPKDHFSSRSYTDFLMDAIRENRDDGKPFLAYLAYQAPPRPAPGAGAVAERIQRPVRRRL